MKRPADMNQHAKLTVGLATGQATEPELTPRQLAGIRRSEKLTPQQRQERAKKAAAARWA